MALIVGRTINYGFATEAARGVWEQPDFYIPRRGGDFDNNFEVLSDESSLGRIEGVSGSALSKQWAEGTFEGQLGATTFGVFLKALFGAEAVALAGGEAAVYEHTFTIQQSAQHTSLSISKIDGNRSFRFNNGVVTSLEINAVLDDYVSFVAGLKARVGASGAINAATFNAESLFVRANATLVRAATLAGLGAGTAVPISNFRITFNPNVIDDDILGSSTPTDFLNTAFMIEAEFDLKYEDDTFHDFVQNQTATYYRFYIENPTTIGVAENPSLQIDLANVKHEEWSRTDENNNIVGQTVKIVGRYSLADSLMVRAILTNTRSTVY